MNHTRRTLVWGGSVMIIALGGAWIVYAEDAVFHDQPASSRSLPGDNLPPFGMLNDQGTLVPTPEIPKGGLHRGPGSPPESTAPGPLLAVAQQAARAAVDSCAKAGYRIGAAVIDSAGEARAMLTADGSDGSHVFVAMRKAEMALEFGIPSSQAREKVLQDKSMIARVKPYMFVEGGAVPIFMHGRVVGAIGASGAGGTVIGAQDEVCAISGLESIKLKLK